MNRNAGGHSQQCMKELNTEIILTGLCHVIKQMEKGCFLNIHSILSIHSIFTQNILSLRKQFNVFVFSAILTTNTHPNTACPLSVCKSILFISSKRIWKRGPTTCVSGNCRFLPSAPFYLTIPLPPSKDKLHPVFASMLPASMDLIQTETFKWYQWDVVTRAFQIFGSRYLAAMPITSHLKTHEDRRE